MEERLLPPTRPEVVVGPVDATQPELPLASAGVQRWLWHGKFGPMLIEVVGERVFVNGQPVEPHRP